MAHVQLDNSGAVSGVFAVPQPGVSVEIPDDDQRLTAFLAKMDAPHRLAVLLGAGCAITSTSMAMLSTTWALDGTTLDQIGSVARDSAAGLGLPGDVPAFSYPDYNGSFVTMDGAQIQALYKALRDYTAQATAYIAGRISSAPAQPVTLP